MKDNALRHAHIATHTNVKQSVITLLQSVEDRSTSTLASSVVPSTAEPASQSDRENFQLHRERRKKPEQKGKM